MRVSRRAAISLVAFAVSASPAVAAVPGSNGPISFTSSNGLAFIDPVTGADVRPRFLPKPQIEPRYNAAKSVTGKIYYSPDTRHLAMNTNHVEYRSGDAGDASDKGAFVGTTDDIGGAFSSGPFFPDPEPDGPDDDLCYSTAKIVAALGDGNLLWKRLFSHYTFQGCNNSATRRDVNDLMITGPGAAPVRRLFDGRAGKTIPGRIFSGTADPDVVFSQAGNGGDPDQNTPPGLYRIHLSTETVERLTTAKLSFQPADASPDGRYIVGSNSGALQRFDVSTGETVTLLTAEQSDALQPADKVGTNTSLQHAAVSPDGAQIALIRVNSNDAGGRDAILTIGMDGTNARSLRLVDEQEYTDFSSVSWQPGPAFQVDLGGGQLVGDLVELDMSVGNLATSPFSNLRYDEGGAPGLVLNTGLYSPAARTEMTLLAGPVPGLAGALAPGQRVTNQYVFGVDKPGRLQVRAKVLGTSPGGADVAREDTAYVVAQKRDLAKWEEAATVAGAYAELHGSVQGAADQALEDTMKAIKKGLKVLPKPDRVRASRATPRERAIARSLGLPDDALAFLPNNARTSAQALHAFLYRTGEAETKVLKRHVGSAYNAALKTPFDYWTSQLRKGPVNAALAVGTGLYDESAYWASKGVTGTKTFGATAYRIVSDPNTLEYMGTALLASSVQIHEAMNKTIPTLTTKTSRRLALQIERDPVGAAGRLGTLFGTVVGESSMALAEGVLTPTKAGLARGIENLGERLSERFITGLDEGVRTLNTLREARGADSVMTAAKLGMPARDATRWSSIVRSLEDFAAKRGYKLDLQLSFRPRNVHTAEIENALGKNMFVQKIKAGDDIDVVLGMDPSGLGKAVVYNPKRPQDFKSLPAELRRELDERIVDMRAGYKEWYDPKSVVGRARRKAGVTASDAIKGNTTTTIHMKLRGVEKNGTVAVQYQELTVDGRRILGRGEKPRWMGSDYDGNAFLQAGGADLPPAIRGQLELEFMRLQREASVTRDGVAGLATSYHGVTKNGFDVTRDTYYRKTFKYLLEGLNDADTAKALDLYLRKYGDGEDYKKLLGTYTNGDLVIQVTRDAAMAAKGF